MKSHPKAVKNYVTANLVMAFANLSWIFVALWMAWGIGAVLVLAAALNHAINRLAVIRRQRAIASTARGKPPSRPSPRQHG